MSKNKTRIPPPRTNSSEGNILTDINIPEDNRKPEISITYLEISSGEFSLKAFNKKCNKNSQFYEELAEFTERVKKYNNIQDLLDVHCPKNGLKAKDKNSHRKMEEIKRKYNVETSDMCHIHLKPNGKGAFVIHGFVLKNCFEIVWIDPEHRRHDS